MAVVLVQDMLLSTASKAPEIRGGIKMAWWHQLPTGQVCQSELCVTPRDGIQPTQALLGWGKVPQLTSDFLLVPGCKPQCCRNECQGPPTPLSPLALTFLAVLIQTVQKPWKPSHHISLPLMLSAWTMLLKTHSQVWSQRNLWPFWKQVMLWCINTRRW